MNYCAPPLLPEDILILREALAIAARAIVRAFVGRGDLDALWPAPHCPRYSLSAVTPRGITGGMGALQTAGG